jgi:hypothetical protein
MTSYTKSGVKGSPYSSSSPSLSRSLNFSMDVAVSMTGNSRINMILDTSVRFCDG